MIGRCLSVYVIELQPQTLPPSSPPQGTTGGPLTGIYPNTFSNGGTEQQGLVLERVQPESTSAERIVGEVDYLDFTIQRDAHGWHCDLCDKRDAMPSQSGGSRVPNIHTALSEACKYGIVHSQMHRFSRRLRRLPLKQGHRQTIGSHDNSWLRSV